jgi:hypothetical protein
MIDKAKPLGVHCVPFFAVENNLLGAADADPLRQGEQQARPYTAFGGSNDDCGASVHALNSSR